MELVPVPGIPEVTPGDDIGRLVAERVDLDRDEIVTVASTIVSKAEGRGVPLSDFEPSGRARSMATRLSELSGEEKDPRFAQAVLEESTECLMEAPFLLTRTRFGHIGVNAGIDRSNTGGAEVLLLPENPQESAATIREQLPEKNPVIVTDTCGRPFRHGQVGVAIGWDGLPAHRDWRGTVDRDGHELEVTVEALVDEIAAASNLVAGEGDDGTPVVVVSGVDLDTLNGSDTLFRDVSTDFVREALNEWTYKG